VLIAVGVNVYLDPLYPGLRFSQHCAGFQIAEAFLQLFDSIQQCLPVGVCLGLLGLGRPRGDKNCHRYQGGTCRRHAPEVDAVHAIIFLGQIVAVAEKLVAETMIS
jgi:hypothetical protein